MPWICADCGAEYATHSPPCRKCGSERFAELAEDDETEIDSMADVQWACEECGEIHQRNSPPCNKCGGFQFSAIDDVSGRDNRDQSPTDPASTPTADGERDQTAYYFGIVGGLVGLVFLPFIFGFVAIVESPLRLFDRSIQNVLPSGASDNDGVTGSFQVFAWAGHATWALFVLGFVAGVFIGLA